jgi:hypothetical protein
MFAAGQSLGYGHTIATVWNLAFQELGEQLEAAFAAAARDDR